MSISQIPLVTPPTSRGVSCVESFENKIQKDTQYQDRCETREMYQSREHSSTLYTYGTSALWARWLSFILCWDLASLRLNFYIIFGKIKNWLCSSEASFHEDSKDAPTFPFLVHPGWSYDHLNIKKEIKTTSKSNKGESLSSLFYNFIQAKKYIVCSAFHRRHWGKW